ncbi:MAG: hypothetical protein GXO40_04465 [Epsilonproteobacteria bacterium]|nr:hypothetical protein [Campylobacterota bacterium]
MEYIKALITEVVEPLERHILADEDVRQYLSTKEAILKHNLGIAKISIALVYDITMAKKLIISAVDAHHRLNLDINATRKYLTLFFKLHKKWATEYFYSEKFHDNIMDRFNKLFMKMYMQSDDDFFMCESEEVDEMIDNMHYEEHKKISADEYFNYDEIMEDDVLHIVELAHECEIISYRYHELNTEFVHHFSNVLRVLAHVLFHTHEFRDIGYAMQNFIKELDTLDIDTLEPTQKEFAWNIINQLNADIRSWIETIFIKKDAVDIHYFDASFLANLAQFDIMLNMQKQVNLDEYSKELDDDDDFFF